MDIDKILIFLQELKNRNVDYVLVGAIAMAVHGIVGATQDVGVFLKPDEGNVSQLRMALKRLFPDDASIDEISAKDLAKGYPVMRYNSPDGSLQIDIISRLGQAFSFDDIQFEERIYDGVPVRVATPEMLYRMKKDTVRLQDRADAEALKEIFNLED